MDADFVNVFITKQKSWIEELLAKHIMMETKLQVTEQKLGEKIKELESINVILEEKNTYINKLVQSNNEKSREVAGLISTQKPEAVVNQPDEQKASKKKKTEFSASADEF